MGSWQRVARCEINLFIGACGWRNINVMGRISQLAIQMAWLQNRWKYLIIDLHILRTAQLHSTMADGVLQLVCECKVSHIKTWIPWRKLKQYNPSMTHGANKAKVHLLGAFGRICLTRKSWMPQRLTLKSVLLPCIHNEAMVLMSYRCGWVRILLCHLGFVLLGSSSLSISRIIPILLDSQFAIRTGPTSLFFPRWKIEET
jgi:hypothetical protein